MSLQVLTNGLEPAALHPGKGTSGENLLEQTPKSTALIPLDRDITKKHTPFRKKDCLRLGGKFLGNTGGLKHKAGSCQLLA